jgi:oxaloacetate decarboxylase beta subunit
MDQLNKVVNLVTDSGFPALTGGNLIMLGVALLLLYLAIGRGFEPLLLIPIAFGALLVNLPLSGIFDLPGTSSEHGGILRLVYEVGTVTEILPVFMFLCLGALTDFGPALANPVTFFLGGAAQLGVFVAMILAVVVGFKIEAAAAIGIIGGADGPTSIYIASKMAPQNLGAIAVASYTYMSLVPLIQPPVIRLLTTLKERSVVMPQLRQVSKTEKIMFPIVVAVVVGLLLPPAVPLIGMMMFGNLLRECGVVERLSKTAQNDFCNIITILLGISVGATMGADQFLRPETLMVIALGLIAVIFSTAGGVLFGKLLYVITKGRVNPVIGAAGVSAVPMSARTAHLEGLKVNPSNFLLMHAMGPNVAGVIGTAVAAAVMISVLS